MTSAPAVSVVMIFLDAEQFIREAIDSVLGQSFGAWELLLVDDGSRDGSVAIAREYAQAHSARIRYLEHPNHENRGMSASRNLGIRAGHGLYVAFLDADDVWLPRKLENQVAMLDARPGVSMVYGPGHYWYAWTGNPGDAARDFEQDLQVAGGTVAEPPSLVPLYLRAPAATPSPSAILARRGALERVGGFEEEFRGMYEDQALYIKLAVREPILVSAEGWYRYRQHENACCTVAFRTGAHLEARARFLTWVSRYVGVRGLEAPGVERALRRELARMRPATGMLAAMTVAARALLPVPARRWLRARADAWAGWR
jgi:glycosyltransferase involved in cell wall biosynthesis